MKQYTKEEVLIKLKEIFPAPYTFQYIDFVFSKFSETLIEIEITSMYEAPKHSFAQLKEVSEFFGTDNVDIHTNISSSGCDTCDYGSSYGFILRIWS